MIESNISFKKLIFPFLCLVLWSFATSKIIKCDCRKKKANIFKVFDCIGSTKKRYVRSYNEFAKDSGNILQLPLLESLLLKVKSSNSFSIKTLSTTQKFFILGFLKNKTRTPDRYTWEC